jgi:glycosyltransferase involved in cell wall biosynthesis
MEGAWKQAGAEVDLLNVPPSSRMGLLEAVRRTYLEARPDGVFLGSVSLLPLVLKGLDGFEGKVLCHTGNPESSPTLTRFKLWMARAYLRPRVDVVVVHCSDYVRKSFQNTAFYRGYRHEVAVSAGLVPMGAPSAGLIHAPRDIGPGQPVRLGMLARLDKIKDHRLVLEAFGEVLASFPEARLEFIGDGSERAGLESRAQDLGLGDKVTFHGRVQDAFPLVRQWDLFLYATTASEGFGAALAEAMGLGMPCVVTDIGPMREVGGEDGAVRYTEAASPAAFAAAIVELLKDRQARVRMSDLARRHAESHFDSALFAGRIREFLGWT